MSKGWLFVVILAVGWMFWSQHVESQKKAAEAARVEKQRIEQVRVEQARSEQQKVERAVAEAEAEKRRITQAEIQRHQQNQNRRNAEAATQRMSAYQEYAAQLRPLLLSEAQIHARLYSEYANIKLLIAKAELANQQWRPNEMNNYIQQATQRKEIANGLLEQQGQYIAARITFIKASFEAYVAVVREISNDNAQPQYARDYCSSTLEGLYQRNPPDTRTASQEAGTNPDMNGRSAVMKSIKNDSQHPYLGHKNPWGKAGGRVVGRYSSLEAAYRAKDGKQVKINGFLDASAEQVINAGDAIMTIQRSPEYRIEHDRESRLWLLIEQTF